MIFDKFADMAIDAAGGGKAVFGSKPGVAEYTLTDLGAETKRATKANIANLPGIQDLLEKILPGYGEMVSQGTKNTLALLRGEIPADVQGAVRRNAAYKAFTGGYGGSGMAKSLEARDFGLTSLGLMNEGANAAQRWAGLTQQETAPWLITGQQQAAQTERNNLYKQAVEQFRLNVEASPDPAAAGLFNTISTIASTAASWGMGSAMGGGGRSQPYITSTTPAGGYGGGFGAGAASAGSAWGG